MDTKVRVSTHNGRVGKQGAFSAKHNDRQFDTSCDEHIDPNLTPFNRNVRFHDRGAQTNEEHELAFYQEHFSEGLGKRNQSYQSNRKPKFVKTMEEYYRSSQSCPEEILYTVGPNIDPDTLWKIYMEHYAWASKEYPQRHILDASLHIDEPNAVPHIHERVVWVGHDGDGMEVVGQEKALREMGVPSVDPTQESHRFNNRKMVFSAENREHFILVCQAYGINIEETPLPTERVGLALARFKLRSAQEQAENAQMQAADAIERLTVLETSIEQSNDKLQAYTEMEVEIDEIDAIGDSGVFGYTMVKSSDLKQLQEQAKAYIANRAALLSVQQRERDLSIQEGALEQQRIALAQQQQKLDALVQEQCEVNQSLAEEKERVRQFSQEVSRLQEENTSLSHLAIQTTTEKNTLTQQLSGTREELFEARKQLALMDEVLAQSPEVLQAWNDMVAQYRLREQEQERNRTAETMEDLIRKRTYSVDDPRIRIAGKTAEFYLGTEWIPQVQLVRQYRDCCRELQRPMCQEYDQINKSTKDGLGTSGRKNAEH